MLEEKFEFFYLLLVVFYLLICCVSTFGIKNVELRNLSKTLIHTAHGNKTRNRLFSSLLSFHMLKNSQT